MKKSLLALAALGTFAGAAHAQSSVTLYGIVDAGLAYANNVGGHHLYETSAGNLQGDRWGLRGTEDLGGGLKALFVLENGFNAFSGKLGQGGDEFGRQAYVGVSSQFGTVTLGRQYDSVVDYTGALEVGSQWASFYGAHPGDLDNMNNSNRVNNSIKYTSANYSGITFGGFSLTTLLSSTTLKVVTPAVRLTVCAGEPSPQLMVAARFPTVAAASEARTTAIGVDASGTPATPLRAPGG